MITNSLLSDNNPSIKFVCVDDPVKPGELNPKLPELIVDLVKKHPLPIMVGTTRKKLGGKPTGPEVDYIKSGPMTVASWYLLEFKSMHHTQRKFAMEPPDRNRKHTIDSISRTNQ
jgi:hypothetical protein